MRTGDIIAFVLAAIILIVVSEITQSNLYKEYLAMLVVAWIMYGLFILPNNPDVYILESSMSKQQIIILSLGISAIVFIIVTTLSYL